MRPVEIEQHLRRRGIHFCIAAWVVFAISLVLPAFRVDIQPSGWLSGWECLRVVFEGIPFERQPRPLYYTMFQVTNLVLVASPLILWRFRYDRRMMRYLTILVVSAGLHAGSFFFMTNSPFQSLGIGYYAWVISFVLLANGTLLLSKRRSQSSEPANGAPKQRTIEEIAALRELNVSLYAEDLTEKRWRE